LKIKTSNSARYRGRRTPQKTVEAKHSNLMSGIGAKGDKDGQRVITVWPRLKAAIQ
jgi:hypothetical protein